MSHHFQRRNFKSFLKSFFIIGVGKSLFIWFLAISFIPLASLSFINYLSVYLNLTIIAEKALVTTSQLRMENIEEFFKQKINFLEVECKHESTIDYFLASLKKNKKESSIEFNKILDDYKYHYQNEYFSNIYYINKNGEMIFSLIDDIPKGTDILRSSTISTLLKNTFNKTISSKTTRFSDLSIDRQKNSKDIESYLMNPIYNKTGNLLGVIAIKIDTYKLNDILLNKANLGKTGEAFLIGEDFKYRSNSRFQEGDIILKKSVTNIMTDAWIDYLKHQDDKQYLTLSKKDKKGIQTYQNKNGANVLGVYRHLYYLQTLGVNWALIEEIEHNEAFAHAQQLSDIAKFAFVITILLVLFISIFVTRWFVNPIKQLSAWTKQVEAGELIQHNLNAPKNEVGEMVDSFNSLVNSLKAYANVSQAVAFGDYSKQVKIRGKEDVMGKSMNKMVDSFRTVVQETNKIANGDFSTKIKPRGDKDTLRVALYEMTERLRSNSIKIKEQDWLKSGINELDSLLSGQTDIFKLSNNVISFLTKYLDTPVGLLYIINDSGTELTLGSSFAVANNKKIKQKIEIGEGLIGQVAKDLVPITIEGNFDNLPLVNIGLDTKTPKIFKAAPFIYEDTLLGVILIGSFKPLNTLQEQFHKISLDRIAIAIHTVKSQERVELLLKQTQDQASELTVQQEELRQANEELEEQTKALRLSEEHLKNQQEELKVINEELEERTNDLEIQRDNIRRKNEELKKAQTEIEKKAVDLQKASQYKSEFLANMSHELRTPLNSILVLSQLLGDNKRGNLKEKEIQFAKTINSSGSDLLDLINEILDLSKVEAGKIDLYIEDLYFDDINHFIDKTFSPLTDKKELYLDFKIQEGLPSSIKTDIQRVYQILKNLLSNAIKFTDKGGITVTIFRPSPEIDLSKSNLKPDNSIGISVQDSGVGIPAEKIELIFEAFKQVDGTTSRKYGGTGLGLTISRSFAETLGGEIKLESESGKGTIFTLFLPLELKENLKEQDLHSAKKEIEKPKKKTTEQKKTIEVELIPSSLIKDDKEHLEPDDKVLLVIEDDKNFCQVLYELAHEKGFKCIITLDGETGLHYADYYQPHAIILDIGLPGIDGYEVMDRLKENTKTRHIPVHFISAADKNINAMKMGAIGYLTKPVNQAKLDIVFKKIENIISKSIKKVLVVEDDKIMRKSIVNLLGAENIKISAVENGEEAYELLKKESFDCQILDLGLKDMSGFDLLEKIRKNKKIVDLPIIIYTGKELTKEEEFKLNKYADSIILKGARSFERLLSETSLFLHQLESDIPEDNRKILKTLHNKESVLENKKILIVDDDMRNVFALSSLLEDKGMLTIVGKDGKEGLQKLKENNDIDLVLMDIMMPEMDGYEATREIRKQSKYEHLPVIALTAKAMKEDREKCIEAGANDYLSKPVDTEKLLSLLRVWLYNKQN
jgi:CheY-like chemotaxis protein/signal transduction histidine kinase/HAMP domain-containing protein